MSNDFNEDAYRQVMVFLTEPDTDFGGVDWGNGDDGNDRDNDDPSPDEGGSGDRPRLRIEVALPQGIDLYEVEGIIRDVVGVVPLNASTQLTSDIVFVGASELTLDDLGYQVTFESNGHYVEGALDDILDTANAGERMFYVNGKVWPLKRFDVVRMGVAK